MVFLVETHDRNHFFCRDVVILKLLHLILLVLHPENLLTVIIERNRYLRNMKLSRVMDLTFSNVDFVQIFVLNIQFGCYFNEFFTQSFLFLSRRGTENHNLQLVHHCHRVRAYNWRVRPDDVEMVIVFVLRKVFDFYRLVPDGDVKLVVFRVNLFYSDKLRHESTRRWWPRSRWSYRFRSRSSRRSQRWIRNLPCLNGENITFVDLYGCEGLAYPNFNPGEEPDVFCLLHTVWVWGKNVFLKIKQHL